MMYRVALCEDEQVLCEAQEKTCREILERLGIEYRITAFTNSADFLHAFMDEQKRFDLILLDIVMDGENGMSLAGRIREADGEAAIIFITSSRDFALDGYKVNALDYLMKPVNGGELERLIASDYRTRFEHRYFMLETDGGKLRVDVRNILYMEISGRQIEVVLTDGKAYYTGKLTELLAELPSNRFVRVHQSFAVNIQNIRVLTRKAAVAVNGKEIPVSRTYAENMQKAFARQMRDG